MTEVKTITALAKDILVGLSASPKHISSKFFYDDTGSRIFQDIMRMPEYYLTDVEFEIFALQKQQIAEAFSLNGQPTDLIELGAGDAHKTKVLLRYFQKQGFQFTYLPVDISADTLTKMADSLRTEIPGLQLEEKAGDYFEIIQDINTYSHSNKIIFFLGSNIGNYSLKESIHFFTEIRKQLNSNDLFFIGMDLKKDPQIIQAAYDDPHGHTREFNLNLLRRLNRELSANFQLDQFRHHAVYDPVSGTAKSYLVSLKDQEVMVDALECSFHFNAFETIYTEMSQKYDIEQINMMAQTAGFEVVQNFFDERNYFVNSLWRIKS